MKICTFIIIFFSITASAQRGDVFNLEKIKRDDLFKLGQVTQEEIDMKTYAADTSAEAVVLADVGYSRLVFNSQSYKIIYRRYKKIKIFKKSAYNYATITVSFYTSDNNVEVVENIKGITHNGLYTKELQPEAIFEERKSEKVYTKKFTLPDVREGSIIEYSYDIESDFVMQLRDWSFQSELPTIKSDYWFSLIPNLNYRILFNRVILAVNTEEKIFSGVLYHWGVENTPALREEPFITNLEDYRSKVWFELVAVNTPKTVPQNFSTTWEAIDRTLITDKEFGGASNKSRFLKTVIDDIKTKIPETDTLQRIKAAYEYVTNEMHWDGKTRYWADRPLKEVFERRGGSSAEINLMLIALLRALDIEANPVVLSTRSNGILSKEYPLLSKLDYVLVHVPIQGKDMLIDATNKYYKLGTIPFECLNGEGRLVSKNSRWIALKPSENQAQTTMATIDILASGKIKAKITETNIGYSAVALRELLTTEGVEKYKAKIPTMNQDWQVSKFEVENLANKDEYLKFITEATVGDEQETDRLYINPIVANRQKDNPFKNPDRTFPVDFGVLNSENYIASINLPEGYVVEELPKAAAYSLPNGGGRFLYDIQQRGNMLQLSMRQILSKTQYSPEEYANIREFYNKIVAKQSEVIVLKKK